LKAVAILVAVGAAAIARAAIAVVARAVHAASRLRADLQARQPHH
jgi:hypothetical protein